MYPRQSLIRLAAHKAELRRKIALQRAECVATAHEVARPLAWVDHAFTVVRELPPLARAGLAVMGLWVRRTALERLSHLSAALRWVPLVSAFWGKRH
ncbi:MAG: hypothetical protein RL376_258 [Verrucomicrobiota bacterium]|jgi:hypothetical protein